MASGAPPADLRQGLLYPQHSADLTDSAPEPWVLISLIPPVMCAPEPVSPSTSQCVYLAISRMKGVEVTLTEMAGVCYSKPNQVTGRTVG